MSMRQYAVVVLGIVMLGWMSKAEENPKVTIVKASAPPVIDGKLDDGCWKGALELADFKIIHHPDKKREEVPAHKTVARLMYDDNYLYIGVEASDPEPDKLCTGACVKRDGGWGDDCIEIFLSPNGGEGYFQWIINARGIILDIDASNPKKGDNTWDSDCEFKVEKQANRWVLEGRIPLAELGLTPATTASWKFTISRWEPRQREGQGCGRVYGHDVSKFSVLAGMELDYVNYVYQVDKVKWGACALGEDQVQTVVRNTGGTARKINGIVTYAGENGDGMTASNSVDLAGGAAKPLELGYTIKETKGTGKLVLAIVDAANGKVYLKKTRYFEMPSELLSVDPDRKNYYMSDKSAGLVIQFRLGAGTLRKSTAALAVLDKNQKEMFSRELKELSEESVTVPLDISGYPAGQYAIQVTLTDAQKNKLASAEGGFTKIKGPFDE